MAQLRGHIITDDDERIGVVREVGEVSLRQPDLVTRDADTGEEVARVERPVLPAARVTVEWEDGSTSELTEHLNPWTVLGATEELPQVRGEVPVPGVDGELPEQRERLAAVNVAELAAAIRAAAPIAQAARAAERTVEVVEDGSFALVATEQ